MSTKSRFSLICRIFSSFWDDIVCNKWGVFYQIEYQASPFGEAGALSWIRNKQATLQASNLYPVFILYLSSIYPVFIQYLFCEEQCEQMPLNSSAVLAFLLKHWALKWIPLFVSFTFIQLSNFDPFDKNSNFEVK